LRPIDVLKQANPNLFDLQAPSIYQAQPLAAAWTVSDQVKRKNRVGQLPSASFLWTVWDN
jgi:hypothetical protein